jgi:hypothetical protein
MNLTKQLEDKKKGCNLQFSIPKGKKSLTILICNSEHICETCKYEIAILEQAIAEMQKQRQEILEIIDDFEEEVNKSEVRTTEEKKVIFVELKLLRIKLQLNQPKTGQ